MKTVQIPYDLFLDLAMYHLRGEDDYEEEILSLIHLSEPTRPY